MRQIQHLVSTFQQIDFGHIYREQNQIVDLLSKQGITKEPGKIHFTTFTQDVMTNVECINFTQEATDDLMWKHKRNYAMGILGVKMLDTHVVNLCVFWTI